VAFTLREARKEDFRRLWEIDQVCFDAELAYSRAELAFYIKRPNAFVIVAEGESSEGTEIHGFIVADRDRLRRGHVITIDVLPQARRQQVGSGLMLAAEQRLRDAGCTAVTLETAVDNRSAIRFYHRLGYSVAGVYPRYYRNGLDALVLEKPLVEAK
jgi:[ribosomal protein S18]-alanine N-acetyltransferase